MSDQIGLFGSSDETLEAAPAKASRGIGPAAVEANIKMLGAQLPAAIHLGTSSWSFPGWAGIVYDKPASDHD